MRVFYMIELQYYILLTTTETITKGDSSFTDSRFNTTFF